MYKQDVEHYPRDFQRSLIKRTVDELNVSHSLTVFSPSGFGKSTLAKFMTFNRKYRSQFSKLKNIHFVYVNLNEIMSEPFEEQKGILQPQVETNKFKSFLDLMMRSFMESDGNLSYLEIQTQLELHSSSDYKKTFYSYIENFIQDKKLVFIMLDEMEALTQPGYEVIKEFLKNLREQYRTKLEYVFLIGDLNYIDRINRDTWGKLTDLLAHKILLLPLPKVIESVLPMHFNQHWLYFNLITKHSTNLKEKISIVESLSGGFPPYFKNLFRIKDFEVLKKTTYSRELQLASERLHKSLARGHVETLRKFIIERKIDQTRYFKELLDMGIIRYKNNSYNIFSPFYSIYLKNIFSSN
jgi:hypothetical protein